MKNTGLVALAESRLSQIKAQQEALISGWKPFLTEVDNYMKDTRGRVLNMFEKRNVAQVLQNALDESGLRKSKLFEATTEDNVSFLGIQLPVIAALLPTLVLNDIAIVQAIDRRLASVFYFDVQYGSNKGSVSSGDTMISARTGHARANKSQRRYAMAYVDGEALIDGSGSTYTGTVAYAPGVKLGTVTIKDDDGNELASDRASDGVLAATDSSGVAGTITAAGVYSIDVTGDTGSAGATINYGYQYDLPVDGNGEYDGVPEINFRMTQDPVEAIDFPIRSKYSVGASIDLLKAHGINLESEVVKYLGNEVKWTIDHYGIDLIVDAATNGAYLNNADGTAILRSPAAAITAWDADVGEGEPWIWKKEEIIDRFEEGSNNIFAATLRGEATFILCGNSVARVIKQLNGFKRGGALGAGKVATGPRNIGTLDDRIVIQDPFMDNETYVMGHKGSNMLYAGFAYSPYIPLFATPTLVTSDLMAQKGFLSSAGFKVTNPALFTVGTITGTYFGG